MRDLRMVCRRRKSTSDLKGGGWGGSNEYASLACGSKLKVFGFVDSNAGKLSSFGRLLEYKTIYRTITNSEIPLPFPVQIQWKPQRIPQNPSTLKKMPIF